MGAIQLWIFIWLDAFSCWLLFGRRGEASFFFPRVRFPEFIAGLPIEQLWPPRVQFATQKCMLFIWFLLGIRGSRGIANGSRLDIHKTYPIWCLYQQMLLRPCILQYIIDFPGSRRSSGDRSMLLRPCILQYIINFPGSRRSSRRQLDAAQTVHFTIYY